MQSTSTSHPVLNGSQYGNTFIEGRIFTYREIERKLVRELQSSVSQTEQYRKGLLVALQIVRGEKK